MSFFTADHISAAYGGRCAIENISFALEAGSVTGVIGANGSGKTTLLKALCGVLPHEGRCALEGEALEKLSPRRLARLCSYIPQRSGVSIDISARDVVLMGFNPQLGLLERPTARMLAEAAEALAQVGLTGMEQRNYLKLSEGQKQLCILARTLVSGSRLLLLDEPESALDFRYRHRMLALLREYVRQNRAAALVALHDPVLALNSCDRLLLLSGGALLGSLAPGEDSLGSMEGMLSEIYGSVSLQRCRGRNGRSSIVMLNEDAL